MATSRRRSICCKQQGLAKADKKSGRVAAQGVVEPYIHAGGRIASLVEIELRNRFRGPYSGFQGARARRRDAGCGDETAVSSPRMRLPKTIGPSLSRNTAIAAGDRGRRAARSGLHQEPANHHQRSRPHRDRQARREHPCSPLRSFRSRRGSRRRGCGRSGRVITPAGGAFCAARAESIRERWRGSSLPAGSLEAQR